MEMSSMEHIDAHLAANPAVLPHVNAQTPAEHSANLCAIYTTARPALVFVKAALGFFKPGWASVIQVLITTLDEVCKNGLA